MPSRKISRKKSSRKTSRKSPDRDIFIFYQPGSNFSFWTYPKLPNGWSWIGSGSTTSINSVGQVVTKIYTREEQFQGPSTHLAKVKSFLDRKFKDLAQKKIIRKYKISTTYNP
ncbi:MAG: hypothetical protein WD512_01885 [Candidatus Paceibacterota bacterium]